MQHGPASWHRKAMAKQGRQAEVYTLLVEVGRKTDDGLPVDATGAALVCYASGGSEEEAVRETVAILKQAGLAPLDVTGYGTVTEREEQGHEIGREERDLMTRARDENAVIVAEMQPLYEDDQAAGRNKAPS